MIGGLTDLGFGIVVFVILIGVGSVVLYNFGNATGGTANTNIQYGLTQLGSTSGGLLTWLPAVIAITIGVFFLGMFGFGGKGGNKGKY